MWFLIILFIAALIAGPVALLLVLVQRGRLKALTAELEQLRDRPVTTGPIPTTKPEVVQPPAAVVAPAADDVVTADTIDTTPEPTPVPAPIPVSAPRLRPPRRDLERILGGQWLTWVGVLALFFGAAFFLAVDLGDSPLAGLPQVLIGLVVAAAFNAVGRFWAARRERVLGLGLLGGGIALLYLAAYAAHGFHGLLPLWLVFPLLLAAATVGALLALDRDSLMIASITLSGAFLTPLVLSGGHDPAHALLPYLVAVNLGAVLVGLRRGWAGLPLASFLGYLVLVATWWDHHYGPALRGFTSLGVTGSWLVFAVAPWLRHGGDRIWSALRGALLTVNGLVYAALCFNLLADGGEDLRGLVLAVLAALYVTLSQTMARRRGHDPATRMSMLTGVALAALFVPVQLSLAWVTLGWLALSAVLVITGLREHDLWHRVLGLTVLALTCVKSLLLDLPGLDHPWRHGAPVLNGEFLTGVALAAWLGWLAWAYRHHAQRLHPDERSLRTPILVLAVVVGLWKLSAEVLGLGPWWEQRLAQDLGQTMPLLMLLLWAVAGAALSLVGLRLGERALRRTGDLVLGGAVLGTTLITFIVGGDLVPGHRPLFNLPLLQGLAVAGALAWVHRTSPRWQAPDQPPLRHHATPALVGALLMVLLKITYEVWGIFDVVGDPGGVRSLLTMSVVWAVYAGLVVLAGFLRQRRPLRVLGIVLLAATVLKVFLVDMQALDRGYRIVAFVVLGVLLLAISRLYQRELRRDEPGPGSETSPGSETGADS